MYIYIYTSWMESQHILMEAAQSNSKTLDVVDLKYCNCILERKIN